MSFSEKWCQFFDQPAANLMLRIAIMVVGIALVAFGIALSRNTDLGLSANSAIPGVVNYATGFSLGTAMFVFSLLLVLAQIVLLRREYNPLQLLSLPFLFIFSAFIDLFVPVTALFRMVNYFARLAFSVLSCVFNACGVWLQAKAALIMLPADGAAQTISHVLRTDFGKTKVVFDSAMIAIAAIASFLLMGGLYGVREGSIIAAVIVGMIIRFIDRCLPGAQCYVPLKGHPTLIPTRDNTGV